MKLTATVTMKDNSTFDVGFDADSVASAKMFGGRHWRGAVDEV